MEESVVFPTIQARIPRSWGKISHHFQRNNSRAVGFGSVRDYIQAITIVNHRASL